MTHISHDQLNNLIESAAKKIVVGGIYTHFKYPERDYLVEKLAIQESSEKVCVVYRDIKSSSAPSFIRDIDSWLESVEWEGKTVPRFILSPKT